MQICIILQIFAVFVVLLQIILCSCFLIITLRAFRSINIFFIPKKIGTYTFAHRRCYSIGCSRTPIYLPILWFILLSLLLLL